MTLTLNLTPTPDPTPTATPTPEPTQVHLRIKEVTEYTGPETYVRDMLAKVRTRGRVTGRPLGVGLGVGPLGEGFRVGVGVDVARGAMPVVSHVSP